MNKNSIRMIVLVSILAMLVSAVPALTQDDEVALRYMLWDTNQLPAYQQCADDFMAANPGISIEIEQLGWDDYWTAITTGFISGDAPDVFTNHLAKYPEMVELAQILDIQPFVDADGVPTDIYYEGLADLWTREGSRYGLPKDWDTIAVVYNAEMFEAAGVDPAVMDEWTWNAEDGGSFEEAVAMLTLDANGNNGLSEDFDAENVVQYGFSVDSMGSAYGQTEWSYWAVSNGFKFNDGPWSTEYYYDDPALAETIDWLVSLWLEKGYAPTIEEASGLGDLALFQAGETAMTYDGSWMIGSYLSSEFEVGFGRLPTGPEGRFSMFNGLADSIFVGTEYPEEAWQWVKYLGSIDCQMVVGESGVVFPAIPEAASASLDMRAEAGVDVSAFVDQANQENGTFLFPIADYAGEIDTIMTEAMDKIGLGETTAAEILPVANEEINDLF